jgi:hypothetical protein
MKIMIRKRNQGVYVGEKNAWTPDACMARLFETPYHALYFCVSKDLDETDIIERFPDGREVRFLKC